MNLYVKEMSNETDQTRYCNSYCKLTVSASQEILISSMLWLGYCSVRFAACLWCVSYLHSDLLPLIHLPVGAPQGMRSRATIPYR